jgi:hypothetical protein
MRGILAYVDISQQLLAPFTLVVHLLLPGLLGEPALEVPHKLLVNVVWRRKSADASDRVGAMARTLVRVLNHVGSAERTVPLVLVLHLDHAADTEQMLAVQSHRQPAEGEA